MSPRKYVLLIQSASCERTLCRLVSEYLNLQVKEAASLATAERIIKHHAPELIFLDFDLRDGQALGVLQYLEEQASSVPVILVAPPDDHKLDSEFHDYPIEIIRKPFSIKQLVHVTKQSLPSSAAVHA